MFPTREPQSSVEDFPGRRYVFIRELAGQYGFSGDGGPALQAELFGPVGLLVDGFDNVYIADNLNNRVRKVASGIFSYFPSPATLAFQVTAGGTLFLKTSR